MLLQEIAGDERTCGLALRERRRADETADIDVPSGPCFFS
jgi:hypothetical protein